MTRWQQGRLCNRRVFQPHSSIIVELSSWLDLDDVVNHLGKRRKIKKLWRDAPDASTFICAAISEETISTLVVHFVVIDVGDSGRASLQDPASSHLVGAVVGDDGSVAPVEILRWRWQVWTAIGLIGAANVVRDDLLRLAVWVAVTGHLEVIWVVCEAHGKFRCWLVQRRIWNEEIFSMFGWLTNSKVTARWKISFVSRDLPCNQQRLK